MAAMDALCLLFVDKGSTLRAPEGMIMMLHWHVMYSGYLVTLQAHHYNLLR